MSLNVEVRAEDALSGAGRGKNGQGKIFYNNLGHNEATWTNPTFMKSVEGSVRWVMNLESGDATPNPAVSKAEDAKAKAVAPPLKEKNSEMSGTKPFT
jgi:trehalose utilization protein